MAPPSSGGYGALGLPPPRMMNDAAQSRGGGEQQPLLGSPATQPVRSSWRQTMKVDVQRDWADIVLLSCYIITGLLDSASISIWGSFVSMQTGNTVYVGLGLGAPKESTRWIKSGCSIISFCAGSFLFSRFHRYFGPKRRWVLCVSFLAQMCFIVAAASIVTFGPSSSKEDVTWNVLAPIALVAFQSCGQAVTSRALKYNALTSVVLTSLYCDLFSDAELFSLKNAERNRRVTAPTLLLIGAVCGSVLAHSQIGIAGALWTASALKLMVVFAWFFWPGEKEED